MAKRTTQDDMTKAAQQAGDGTHTTSDMSSMMADVSIGTMESGAGPMRPNATKLSRPRASKGGGNGTSTTSSLASTMADVAEGTCFGKSKA